MDFGSIVESLSNGPFNWATGPITSACAHNCFDKNHYHRYCGCALHAIDSAFKGSPARSPSSKVKVSGSGNRSGRMYRSISVQNFGEKKFQSCNISCNYSGDEPASPAAFSPSSFSSSVSSLSQLGFGRDDLLSVETLTLVEELASFINLMKDEDAGSNTERDYDEIESDASGSAADEDEGSHASWTISYSSQPILVPSRSLSPKALNGLVSTAKIAPDHVRPLRLSLLEKLSNRPPSPRLDAAVKRVV
ncbi:unnamed protein product [Calypogeia fissa]